MTTYRYEQFGFDDLAPDLALRLGNCYRPSCSRVAVDERGLCHTHLTGQPAQWTHTPRA